MAFRAERVSELMAGLAALSIMFVTMLFWTFLRGANVGTTMKAAVNAEVGLSAVTMVCEFLALALAAYSASRGETSAHWGVRTLQVGAVVLATFVVGGVAPRISVPSVYQKGQADPQVNNATVLCWFAWVWALVWMSLRTWNDANAVVALPAMDASDDDDDAANPAAAPTKVGVWLSPTAPLKL